MKANGAEISLGYDGIKQDENVLEMLDGNELRTNFFARIEKCFNLKEQYFCCCSINIWMLTIAAITIVTAIKTQIALLIIDGFTGSPISFILIFPVWISGILAIFAYIHKMPLLIWPFIAFLIFISLSVIAFLIYFTMIALPAKINGDIFNLLIKVIF
ncbi:hypothetical protein LOAG_08997 [Loa loa]|uniref:Uncharacterized protein n=1 Tax=Loa loa TaxID=7209 RepID=A0A1S0TU61_LOALO|nr:hypothetical protein LOAG_08997 [Loa loa]EFO19494.1 hypothetical protein LOAG_08997 [Loa loa]